MVSNESVCPSETHRERRQRLVVLLRGRVARARLLLLLSRRGLEPGQHALDVDGVAVSLLGGASCAHLGCTRVVSVFRIVECSVAVVSLVNAIVDSR